MAISRDISDRIKEVLRDHPDGLSITGIIKILPINRNTAGRYLDALLISGQVEMRHFGMAKIYSLAKRLPVSSVLSISSEYVLQVDQGFRIVYLNAPFLRLLGLPEQEFAGRKIEFTRIPAVFGEKYPTLLRWISEGLAGVERQGEIALAAKNRIFSCRVTPAVFSDGQRGVSVLFEDITARKQDEKRLRDSEEKFRTLFNNSADIITVHGIRPDGQPGTFLEVNDVACRMLGYTRTELLRMSPQDISDPTIREPVQENAENLRADGHAIFEMVYIARNGRRIPVEVRSHLFEYQQKTLVLGQARDISRRKEAEAAIHESEARVKSIIRVAPIGIGLVAGRTFREVNERLCTMTGYTSGELIGQSVHMLYSTNAEFDRVGTELYSQMRREVTGSIETRWRRKNGESVDILLNSTPLDPHNPYAGDIFTALDITRRKLGEQAARAGEERYRQLIERSFNAVVVLEQGVIRIANDAACTIIGVQSPGQLNGQPLLAFIHPDFHDFVTSQLAELLAAPGSAMPLMRLTGRRLNGGDVEIDVMAASFLEDGVPAVQAVFREVSGSR